MQRHDWGLALAVYIAAALGTEAVPLVFGAGVRARVDWGFVYVSMKFGVIPSASLLILALLSARVWRKRTLSLWPVLAGVVAVVHLIGLYVWPLPWFV